MFHSLVISTAAILLAQPVQAEGFEDSVVTGVKTQYNDTTWAASNLIDGNDRTRWLSRDQTNDINFLLSSTGDPKCFEGLKLKNYTNSGRNIKEFALLTTSDDALAGDFGTAGWQPIVAEQNPTGLINYLSWAQGARIVSIDAEYNATTWAGEHINDGDTSSRWISRSGRNIIEYNFDTDWNGTTGDGITIDELEVFNFGTDDIAVKEFQIEYTTDGVTWQRLEVPSSMAGDPEYIFSRDIDGGILGLVDSAYNNTNWTGDHINDGDQNTLWLSRKGNNSIEFTFDPSRNGISGANGDLNDLFNLDQIRLINYGENDDRSIRQFQVAVKTLSNPNWQKLTVPGAQVGEANYNFALSYHGGLLSEISSQVNTTNWGADNIHDGDQNTRWLSQDQSSQLAFRFDANEDGVAGEPEDQFTFEEFYMLNYGNDDRSIKQFQIQVTTASNNTWQNIPVPGAAIGDANFNFALVNNGTTLNAIDSELNATSWAAANIHDGNSQTRWLSRKSNNVLEFGFSEAPFMFERLVLQNYGDDDRSIKEFQIEVLTANSLGLWKLLPVPGATINDPNFNFALDNNGAELSYIESEYNTTSLAAKNIHDGDESTRWLARKSHTKLDFVFDVNGNGVIAEAGDRFTVERVYIKNYGNDDRSIKDFQLAYQTLTDTNWQYIQVPNSVAGVAGYDFVLPAHGGSISRVDSEYNSTSWASKNIHDGNYSTRWLSRKQDNEIDFTFDTDRDGVSGDSINLDTIELINYGIDDRSVATFSIQYQQAGGAWQNAQLLDGSETINAAMNNDVQTWSIKPLANVTAVRFKTYTNHGDPSYTGVREIRLKGATVGPTYSFQAQMSTAGQYFELDNSNLPTDITAFRLETVTNHGDPRYTGAAEFRILGPSISETTIFTALQSDAKQEFILDSDDVPTDVIGVRLRTISNHGDPTYTGAKEFEIIGPAVSETTIFEAQQIDTGQTFTLDANDVVNNVTGVRLVTINNHGDRSYIGAREFEVRGSSVTESKTFEAQMGLAPQSFRLDPEDIANQVTDVKFITINNHGDPSYIGAREIEILGQSVTPAHSFYLPQSKGPHQIVLDDEDKVSGATGVRFITINNHGDRTYTGLTELRILGTAITPSYIFKGENTTRLQDFSFDSTNAKYLRLHTMTSYGSSSDAAAAELSLVEGNCASGQWRLDEFSWDGSDGEVLDSSGSEFHGKALGFGNGTGANTAFLDSAIAGSPGTCRYGVFDGVDDYIEVEDRDSLDNTSQITLSAWFKADSLRQTNGTNARGLLSKRPDFNSNISYGMFFLNGGNNRLYIDIDGHNNRFATQTRFNTDQWYHVAVVFDGSLPSNERVSVYVDGVLDGKYRESSTLIQNTNSNFYIGNLYTGTRVLKVFDGSIDEVNVIPFAYSQGQINKLMRQTRPCAAGLDHIEISHSGSGVSCAAHTVNLKACANADCSALYTGSNIDFTLQKDVAGVITDLATYTIDGTTGVLNNAQFVETNTGVFSFTGDASLATNVECVNTSSGSNSCDYNVSASGYIVTSGNNNTAQSCTTNSFVIQAVKSPDTGVGGACVPAYASGNFPLTFSYSYVNPDGSSVLNTASANIQGQVHTASQTGSAVNVAFDANAQAQIDVSYVEAGQISIVVNDADGKLSSTSAVLGYIPSKLSAQWADGNANNLAAIDEQVVISGQCADGTVLQNYVPSGKYLVQANRSMPSDAEILSVNSSLTPNDLENLVIANSVNIVPNSSGDIVDVSASANTNVLDLNYDEAARLQLTFTDTDYLGQSITTDSALDGFFAINHYSASVNTPTLASSCNMFSYIGQEIDWSTKPEVTLTARNAINQVTQFADVLNYWQQNITDISTGMIGNTYVENTPNANNTIGVNNSNLSIAEIDLDKVDGSRSYQISNQLLQYLKTRTPDIPFNADVNLTIPASAFIDSFGIGIKNDNTDTSFQAVVFSNIVGPELVYGRMKVDNAFGSELQDLPWRGELQMFNSSRLWQRQENDSCTVFSQDAITIDGLNQFDVINNPPKYTLDTTNAPTQLVNFETQTSVTAISGFISLPFAAPGNLNIGSVNIDVDLSLDNSFLRWDWDASGTGTFTDADGDGIDDALDLNLPTTKVTFGRFRGNERIIYKRER